MSDGGPTRTGFLSRLVRAHDALTWASFNCAAGCLAAIVVSYFYEVVARYFFNAPTSWASALVSYALCGVVFLAAPELTRKNIHIVIHVLTDRIPAPQVVYLQRVVELACVATCLFAAWIVGVTSVAQYHQGIVTILNWPIPKWPLTAVVTYGLLSTGVYFLRHLVSGSQSQSAVMDVS